MLIRELISASGFKVEKEELRRGTELFKLGMGSGRHEWSNTTRSEICQIEF